MINARDIEDGESLFTYHDEDTNTEVTIAITRLRDYLRQANAKTRLVALTLEFASYILTHRGVDEERFKRLTREHCDEPLIMCDTEDGQWLLADGNHRYVKLVMDFLRDDTRAYMVTKDVWKNFVVDDAPLKV